MLDALSKAMSTKHRFTLIRRDQRHLQASEMSFIALTGRLVSVSSTSKANAKLLLAFRPLDLAIDQYRASNNR